MLPGGMVVQRVARPVEGHVVGQRHRQLLVRHRHDATGVAVDHRDRAAPVALAGHSPVAQPPIGDALTDATLFQCLDRGALGGVDLQPVEEGGVEDGARTDVGLGPDGESRRIGTGRQHDGNNVQMVFPGELKIALVVRGTAEDRPGAVSISTNWRSRPDTWRPR